MRIAIVNDMAMALEVLRRVITQFSDHEIAWTALDGAEAIEKSQRDTPDLILMDLIMPNIDGVEATRQIMNHSPCPILIVTASVEGNMSKVFEAMGHGALDVTKTPTLGMKISEESAEALIKKIETIKSYLGKKEVKETVTDSEPASLPKIIPDLVVIGASTGGPSALVKILKDIPETTEITFAIVQHVDVNFAQSFVEWLDKQTPLPVKVAKEREELLPGHVYVASKEEHLIITNNQRFGYTSFPKETSYTPSIDVFFNSVSEHWPKKGVGILLTGMGSDGAQGMVALKNSGWQTVAEDASSCVVFGMPKAAIEKGGVTEVLPIDQIKDKIKIKAIPKSLAQV